MGRIVAIANQKGGVGKTTTAISLAAALAIAERRTLLIDLDPQASSTKGLGLHPGPAGDIYQVLSQEVAGEATILPTELEYLSVLPASRDLVGIELELVEAERREYRLKEALGSLRSRFSYIIIDCPPSLGLLTVNALAAADAILIPVQCEYLALEGVSNLVETLERIRTAFNPNLEIDGVVLTMYDDRTNLARQVVDDIRTYFKDKVFSTIIPRNVRLGEAPSFGRPIMLYDIKSKGAESYLNLAREVIQRHEKTSTRQRAEQPHTGA
jgi:chromosome partitioning protein